MNVIFEGEEFHDYLDAFLYEEEINVVNDLSDIQLKGRVAKDDFIIKDNYSLIIDALENRERLRLNLFQRKDFKDDKSLNTKNLGVIYKNEKFGGISIEEIKMIFRECPIDELLNRLEKLLKTKILAAKSFNDCLSLIISYGFNNEKQGYEISIKDFNLLIDGYTCLIKVNTLYILIKAELRRKIIDAHINWRLSPEIRKRYIERYDDFSSGLKAEGRYLTRDVMEFYKNVYKLEKYEGLRYGDPIPRLEDTDFFNNDNIIKKRGKKIDEDYQKIDEDYHKKGGKYLISESTIEELFNKYGKFWDESLNSWRERFIDIEGEELPKISRIEESYKFKNNRHLLITILVIIYEKNQGKPDGMKALKFDKYVLNRWGIKDFKNCKSKYFTFLDKRHPLYPEIKKMV